MNQPDLFFIKLGNWGKWKMKDWMQLQNLFCSEVSKVTKLFYEKKVDSKYSLLSFIFFFILFHTALLTKFQLLETCYKMKTFMFYWKGVRYSEKQGQWLDITISSVRYCPSLRCSGICFDFQILFHQPKFRQTET